MRLRKQIDFPKFFLYLTCGVSAIFLFQIGDQGEPFSLALCFGMASAGLSPFLSALIFLLSSFSAWESSLPIYLVQALLLIAGFFLQRRYGKNAFLKTGFLPLLALCFALALFFLFAPFQAYQLIPLEGSLQKACLSLALFLLSLGFSVTMKALIHKLLKCRLRDDEILFILLSFILIGVGICRFFLPYFWR